MKTLKLSILVSLLLAIGTTAFACGPFYFSSDDNDIYRILPYGMEGPRVQLGTDFCKENILLWSRQTGCSDTAAIKRAIYQGSLADWEQLYIKQVLHKTDDAHQRVDDWFFDSNRFVKAIRRDSEAIRLLYWSKMYEAVRLAQQSPWYYNSAVSTDETRQLQQLYDSLQIHKPQKYADRYAFLSMKCSWALGNDSATIALWKQFKPQMKGSILYNEAEDYLARSLTRMGRTDEAMNIYKAHKDIEMLCGGKSLPELLATLLRVAPDHPLLTIELQRMLFSIENNPYVLEYRFCPWGYEDVDAILPIARRAAQTTIRSRRAVWQYTAACLLDHKGQPAQALQQLEGIDTLPCDNFLKKSIRVLRFYLHGKTDSISNDFEQYALAELQWMDKELQQEWERMPNTEKYKLSRIASAERMRRSCYMYDAMRRILLPDKVGICQRMAAEGYEVRALQFANMAENRLLQLSDNQIVKSSRVNDTSARYTWGDDQHEGFSQGWYYWWTDTSKYHHWHIDFNYHDYSNWMFLLADKMSAHTLEQYYKRVQHPEDKDDRWLNARDYTDKDYWQDIIGTHYLRECNYAKAVAHLKHVSAKYQRRMNVQCFNDPFGYKERIVSYDSTNYKLNFAKRMVELQQQMIRGNNDDRGWAMLEYSIGMRNSFDMCWYLTSYGKIFEEPEFNNPDGYWPRSLKEWQEDVDPVSRLTAYNYPYKQKHTRRADYLQQTALKTIKSDDAKAKAYARLGLFSKMMKNYANTPTAQHYALVCDQWKDYRLKTP